MTRHIIQCTREKTYIQYRVVPSSFINGFTVYIYISVSNVLTKGYTFYEGRHHVVVPDVNIPYLVKVKDREVKVLQGRVDTT